MIVFDLKCEKNHTFEAWFGSSSSYEEQKNAGFLECPHCGSHDVSKAVMAPNVGVKSNQKSDTPRQSVSTVAASGSSSNLSPGLPANLPSDSSVLPSPELMEKAQSLIEEFRQTVETNCENVGENFAEEARKIHYGETEERGIYGESTPEETAELLDEGIEVLPMPSPRRSDA